MNLRLSVVIIDKPSIKFEKEHKLINSHLWRTITLYKSILIKLQEICKEKMKKTKAFEESESDFQFPFFEKFS